MSEENLDKQKEEIEALTSIFADDFRWLDEGCFSVCIADGRVQFTFTVNLNDNYPGQAPPTYSIQTEGLSPLKRRELDSELGNLYCDGAGECIVFQWITATKTFLEDLMQATEDAVTVDEKEKEEEEGEGEYEDEDLNVLVEDVGVLNLHTKYIADAPSYCSSALALPVIHHGETLTDRKSVFQGHIASVLFKQQVEDVLENLKENKKIAAATHNILAYRIELSNGAFNSGCDDDGEHGASSRMLNLLNIVDARNVLVVVTRWYGGIHLGPDRFKHINSITRDLLDAHGFIKQKVNAKKKKENSSSSAKTFKQKKKR